MPIAMPSDILVIFNRVIPFVRVLFILFGVFEIGFIIWALLNTNWLRRRILQDLVEVSTYKPYGLRKVTREWLKIKTRLNVDSEAEYKLAIIDADSLLDNILKDMGYSGNSLGERLNELAAITLPSIEKVREAHKVRSNIIHDPDYNLSFDQTRDALVVYEAALKELEAL